MKKLKIKAIIFILFMILFYLIGCFIQLSFDISKWTEYARVLVGLFGTALSFLIVNHPDFIKD